MYKKLFTSESATVGHPDKICDQISDCILDACLQQDPESRVACEVSINSSLLVWVNYDQGKHRYTFNCKAGN